MKYLVLTLAAVGMVACGASSDVSKTATQAADLSAQLPALSGENIWNMDAAESRLTFKAVHNGREFTGTFGNFDAVINLDPANPAGGEVHVIVDLSSVDAGDRDRNSNLPTKDWFHVETFPMATFTSTDLSKLSGSNYVATGNLSLKGVSKPITLAFTLNVEGDTAQASGGVDLVRTDFNIGQGPDFETEDWVKFPVAVMFDIKAVK